MQLHFCCIKFQIKLNKKNRVNINKNIDKKLIFESYFYLYVFILRLKKSLSQKKTEGLKRFIKIARKTKSKTY